MINISSVVITRNEEKNIKKCLTSLINSFQSSQIINKYEIIVVDSNSIDNTLKIVRKFNRVKIVSLTSSSYYSAAMGRKVGSELAKYDYILFIDGDVELCKDWLNKAIPLMRKYNVQGVMGDLIDINYYSGEIRSIKKRYDINKIEKARHLGGNILVNKNVLLKCGNYNPYLLHNEEAEMYSRFLNYGEIIQIPFVMGKHHTDYLNTKEKLLNLLNIKLEFGRSLAFKNSIKNKNLKNLIWIYKDFSRTFLTFCLSVLLLFTLFISPTFSLYSIILINFLNFLVYLFKKKPLRFIADNIILIKFLKGLFKKVENFNYSYKLHNE